MRWGNPFDFQKGSEHSIYIFPFQTEFKGVTGWISFREDGFRKDYQLDVLELSLDSEPTKVQLPTSWGFFADKVYNNRMNSLILKYITEINSAAFNNSMQWILRTCFLHRFCETVAKTTNTLLWFCIGLNGEFFWLILVWFQCNPILNAKKHFVEFHPFWTFETGTQTWKLCAVMLYIFCLCAWRSSIPWKLQGICLGRIVLQREIEYLKQGNFCHCPNRRVSDSGLCWQSQETRIGRALNETRTWAQ